MRLSYTSTQREFDAGIFVLGHFVTPQHIIPPNVKNFTTTTVVTEECTRAVSCMQIYLFQCGSLLPLPAVHS